MFILRLAYLPRDVFRRALSALHSNGEAIRIIPCNLSISKRDQIESKANLAFRR
jgi:hypothetical protein